MPTKLARTVASSVCGLISHWRSATITAITAAPTIPAPSNRPMTRRAPGSDMTCSSAIKLNPGEKEPKHESDENAKARIDQPWRTDIRIESHPDKEPSSKQSRRNPNQRAEHPGREE